MGRTNAISFLAREQAFFKLTNLRDGVIIVGISRACYMIQDTVTLNTEYCIFM